MTVSGKGIPAKCKVDVLTRCLAIDHQSGMASMSYGLQTKRPTVVGKGIRRPIYFNNVT